MAAAPRGAQRASSSRLTLALRKEPARLPVSGAAIIAALTLLFAAPIVAHEPVAADTSEAIPQKLARSLRPGDRLSDHGVGLEIPRPGESIRAHIHYIDGTSQTLFARTRSSGDVAVRSWGDEGALAGVGPPVGSGATVDGAVASASSSATSECADKSNNSFGFRVPDHRWRYNRDSTPQKFRSRPGGVRSVIDAIIRANRNITDARNDCGRPDRVSATFDYRGDTSRRANIGRDGYCSRSDGRSVISWGALPSRSAAMACMMTFSGGVAHESDIKINWKQRYETSLSACNNEFMVEAAMTHEFGHVYGLAHVGSYSSPNLTMNPLFGYCSLRHASLGLGDIIGLERKY